MTTQKPLVTIYTDGSASPNPGPGGWAALLIYGDAKKELSGADPHTTNNRMELTAAVRALEALNRPCQVEMHTDSEYLRKGITEWIHGWLKNGWRTTSRKPVENQELWMRLHELAQQHDVHWNWVRGHAADALNRHVDRLANAARTKQP